MITDEGLNRIRDLIATDFEKGQLGTGTNAVTTSDTDLQTKKAGTDIDLEIATTDRQITVTYTNPSTGTLDTYTEYKTFNDASSYDYDRIVFTGVAQTTSEDLIIIKRYFMRRS
jgi:hypothetical protein